MYSVVEIFTSLQGEGRFVGHPVNFVRLAGCSMGCKFCDTDIKEREALSTKQIIDRLDPKYSRRVVITGGEPLEQDIAELTWTLSNGGFIIHLETNGTRNLKGGVVDWVSLSPKPRKPPLMSLYYRADEIKWLVPLWKLDDILPKTLLFDVRHYVQPVNNRLSINKKALQKCLEYIKRGNGKLLLSVQLHKLLGLK
jgi:organic radical activating enzyme